MNGITITLDELLAEYEKLRKQNASSDGYYSNHELQDLWNISQSKVGRILRTADKLGVLRSKYVPKPVITGRVSQVPVYSFIRTEEPKKKRA